ncbi:TPA: quorum-sensing system DWW-type pheromone, partial [Streptococcus pyogenes]|nr:quorum-sensing system DWW-type pheromone [Streptococcus pyogenes]HEP2113131.1 quorum-sensing system DWW-type pheromone [Streptococcus pyogenes]HEP2204448.1 quorum-sensing system DWW-type pheromone [Streptococcus pyogenes]HEP2226114.1 quorum-sensing system DWW-type pheromone [Streptococcus pyogenes]HEP2254419.1 quorum-sensing system DWW-type pheromone [Streptococcus pyogenes]
SMLKKYKYYFIFAALLSFKVVQELSAVDWWRL